ICTPTAIARIRRNQLRRAFTQGRQSRSVLTNVVATPLRDVCLVQSRVSLTAHSAAATASGSYEMASTSKAFSHVTRRFFCPPFLLFSFLLFFFFFWRCCWDLGVALGVGVGAPVTRGWGYVNVPV